GEGGDHQDLRARGHRSREGWAADEAEEDLRCSGSRGAERAVPKGPAFQARLRGADAGAAEELPVPLCRRQAVGDTGGANRKGDAGDIRRQGVPGETLATTPASAEKAGGSSSPWSWERRSGTARRALSASPHA